ncbi:type I-E CRISPR-associated endoribonuclease Cas2e [Micromonospora carbonacea]|uniref:Type I-E CRISPR-associated endoribonuclease Cas2 n=1 Tax=Micromonospora carbonacea TaxID=47853 RepID=A0A7H8XDY2_9ACTN|nr:type I-E CRISPR-associated endoribonuclease Cas2e [Micromonospora carbonacea]MBB5829286.1 CRISPR-associated protein Cas2 [Micromonospora carbonacea]QLD23253.1 type I-E CRISPR-associated endoribonuclease Cas2 [Micromonospora carbonacea]
MTVIILTACPEGLRGHLTQWLLEISAGVYVGHVNSRIRQRLWAKVVEMAGPGRALLVYQRPGEQRLTFEVHDHHWEPVDFDGISLMRRPTDRSSYNPAVGRGWSKASKRRKFGRRAPDGASGLSTPSGQSEGKGGS